MRFLAQARAGPHELFGLGLQGLGLAVLRSHPH